MPESVPIRVLSDRRASPDGGEHFHDYVAGQVYTGGSVPPMSASLAAEALREGWGEAIQDGANRKRSEAAPARPGSECLWCGALYTARKQAGGPARRFCCNACRAAFHRGARRWAARELEAGRLDIADLRNA